MPAAVFGRRALRRWRLSTVTRDSSNKDTEDGKAGWRMHQTHPSFCALVLLGQFFIQVKTVLSNR
jgi:hypothetical protein